MQEAVHQVLVECLNPELAEMAANSPHPPQPMALIELSDSEMSPKEAVVPPCHEGAASGFEAEVEVREGGGLGPVISSTKTPEKTPEPEAPKHGGSPSLPKRSGTALYDENGMVRINKRRKVPAKFVKLPGNASVGAEPVDEEDDEASDDVEPLGEECVVVAPVEPLGEECVVVAPAEAALAVNQPAPCFTIWSVFAVLFWGGEGSQLPCLGKPNRCTVGRLELRGSAGS